MERIVSRIDNGWVKYDPETNIYHLFDEETRKEYFFEGAKPYIDLRCYDCQYFNSSAPVPTVLDSGWCDHFGWFIRPANYCMDFTTKENE